MLIRKAGEYHVIAAGSLLGTLLATPKSYPVGMINLLDIYPLTFHEFLEAIDPARITQIQRECWTVSTMSQRQNIRCLPLISLTSSSSLSSIPDCSSIWRASTTVRFYWRLTISSRVHYLKIMFCSSFAANLKRSPGIIPIKTAKLTSYCNTARRSSLSKPKAVPINPRLLSKSSLPGISRNTLFASLPAVIERMALLQTFPCILLGGQESCCNAPNFPGKF